MILQKTHHAKKHNHTSRCISPEAYEYIAGLECGWDFKLRDPKGFWVQYRHPAVYYVFCGIFIVSLPWIVSPLRRKKKPRGYDHDICNRSLRPESLSNEELIEAVSQAHRDSTEIVELLDEAGRRGLAEIVPIARKYVDDGEPFVAASAVAVLGELGDASDIPRLLALVDDVSDRYLLAAVLCAVVAIDVSRAEEVLGIADRDSDRDGFDNDYVAAAVMLQILDVLPDDSPELETRLLNWANDKRFDPSQRDRVFKRMAEVPRTKRIEDFFVDFTINDDGLYPELTKIVEDALRERG